MNAEHADKLQGVHLSMSRMELQTVLGEPEHVGGTSRKYPRPQIWKYGDLEFFFAQGQDLLCGIYAEDADGNCVLSISLSDSAHGDETLC